MAGDAVRSEREDRVRRELIDAADQRIDRRVFAERSASAVWRAEDLDVVHAQLSERAS